MIKLNNKNITYVALADSNNSLKAPKEIWYADTNNSVKLVYQRKDALIEGEDYEKYHWLDGDGSAYLDVKGFSRNENWEIVTKLRQRNINTWVFLYGVGMVGNSYDDGVWTAFGGTAAERVAVRVSNGTTYRDYYLNNITENQEIQVIDKHSSVVFNGNVISVTDTPNRTYKQCNEFYIFSQYYTNRDTPLRIADADFSDFIVNESGINILNLIPCKLLKSVPKWLDANGIRRQAGECGMIDLVSGKFYGNVNSVGTFTVENYYERKEWLVGDGSAYIRTNHTLNEDLDWEVKVANFTDYKCLFWQREGDVTNNLNTVLVKAVNYFPGLRVGNKSSEVRINPFSDTEIIVSTSGDTITINGQPYQVTKGSQTAFGNFALFYTAFHNDSTTQDVCCAYFRFLDSNRNYIQNLIPCTLTMDLPASMDANNIARTKGTSGMWDLVSDRFYGNVANSGTFKAVNLAEGVDYEVHQWLVAEIYPQTGMMWIPVNSSNFSFIKENGNIYANLVHFVTSGYVYYTQTSSMGVLSVWDNTNGVFVMSKTVGSTMEFNSTSQGLSVNNTNITQYGFPVSRITFQTSSGTSNIVTTKTSAITVDGIERYIPVKLLRSIPPRHDANGIARQAGECGMYDTVNDLFYGNVASSGTFTVADD